MKSFLYLLIILIVAISCEKIETGIIVENRTSKHIYCVISSLYPDTTFTFIDNAQMRNEPNYLVAPYSSGSISSTSYCEKTTWADYVPSGTMILFVFDKDVVDQIPWTTIKSGYKVFRKYNVTYDQLRNNKCTIVVE